MSIVRFIKDKLTKRGNIVSKWVFQPDPNKDYSDFELIEKSLNIMIEEEWVLERKNQKLTIKEFINAVWEERF